MASIAETLIENAFTALRVARPSLSSDIGEKFLAVNAKTTRIVGVPRGTPSEFRQPDRHGDGNYANAGRILLLRDFLIHWQIWDLSFELTENLMLDLVRTLRKQNHHTITFMNEVWEDQQDEQDGWDKRGTLVSLDCTIALPIYEQAPIRVPLTGNPEITTEVKLPASGGGETVTINEGTP